MQSKMWTVLAGLAAVAAGCGDNQAPGDARRPNNDSGPDMAPAPPVLGAQLDRMGRAAIVPTLIGAFDTPAAQTAMREAYARASDPATWKDTTLQTNIDVKRELQITLATWDGLDVGPPLNKTCTNAMLYAGPTDGRSYANAALLLADDQLYVDTAKSSCNLYLALEIEFVSSLSLPHTACGGRTPSYDAIDMTYSLWIAGWMDGLDNTTGQSPRVSDGVARSPLPDVFPFLAAPH